MFGEKLKNLRIEAGMTQAELADKIMVSRTAVSKWERNKGYPAIDSLKLLSEVFGLSIDSLISDEDISMIKSKEKSSRFQKIIVVICIMALLAIPVVQIAGKISHRVDKTLYFALNSLNFGMEECLRDLDKIDKNGEIDREGFRDICNDLFRQEFYEIQTIKNLGYSLHNPYHKYNVTFLDFYICTLQNMVGHQWDVMSEEDLETAYISLKFVCTKWTEFHWSELGDTFKYDFLKDPEGVEEKIIELKGLVEGESEQIKALYLE